MSNKLRNHTAYDKLAIVPFPIILLKRWQAQAYDSTWVIGKFLINYFLKMGQYRPLFDYFRSFHFPIQMTNIQFEQYKLKKA